MKKIVSTFIVSTLVASNLLVFPVSEASGDQPESGVEIEKVLINDRHELPTYLKGRLSLPSKNAPEDIVKDYMNKSSGVTNSCKIEKKFVNEQGETVVKAQQMYKGIKIRGASQSYIIGKDGVIETISGLNIPKVKNLIKEDIKLSEKDAKEVVKKDLGREFKASDTVSVEKIIVPDNNVLKYAFSVRASFVVSVVESWEYIVDASSGKVLEKIDLLMYKNEKLTGTGYFNDIKELNGYSGTIPDVNITPKYTYSLADLSRQAPDGAATRPFKILTYNFNPPVDVEGAIADDINKYREISSDPDKNFNDREQSHSVDAHYNAGIVYEYYKDKFGRYSFDNEGADIDITCHALFRDRNGNLTPSNACYDTGSKKFYFGDGDGTEFGSFAADPETLGHEFTHAVIDSESGLEYCYQAGAISEGLADFFGEVIEAYAKNGQPDWKKMGLVTTPGTPDDAYLDYKNPEKSANSSGETFPGHMNEIYKGNGDNMGVHINAAILTKALSLMSDGGTYHNVNVNAIGIDKVATVMYKVITEYLTTFTNFSEFAEASVDAAGKIYGENSIEQKSIRAGFQAVGIINGVSQWSRISKSPFEVIPDSFNICQLGSKVYVQVGVTTDFMDGSSEFWEYDIVTNQWNKKADVITPRIMGRMVAVNNKVYVFYGVGGDFSTKLTSVDEYDPQSNKWRTVSNVPNYRDGAGIAVYNNKVYIVGGRDRSYKYVSTMDVYDPINNSWTTGLSGLTARDLVVIPISVNGVSKLYAFFGEDNSGKLNKIMAYDFNKKVWKTVGTSPITIRRPAVAQYKGKIHFVGGGKELDGLIPFNSSANGATLIYDPVTGSWDTKNIPGLPGVLGICPVYNDRLYFMGTANLTIFNGGPIMVESYDPLRINAFDNNNSVVVQWSKFDDTTNSKLYIDNQTMYNGNQTGYVYNNFLNSNGIHTMTVTQNHPIYGSISSKPLSGAYIKIGDINYDNEVSSIDFAYLKKQLLNENTLTALQKVAADLNEDGSVDSIDYAILKAYLLNRSSNCDIGGIRYILFGDVNFDGKIDSQDISVIQNALSDTSVLTVKQFAAADVDGDGKVTQNDISCINNYMVSDNYKFPVAN